MTPPRRQSQLLAPSPHGFFGRAGGVSGGIYATLNAGPGSADSPEAVAENRARASATLGTDQIVTAYQTHSTVAAYIDAPPTAQINADALVTDRSGLAIGVLAADCVPVLFAGGKLVAAAHAGWRGSFGGILEATINLLEQHGADLHQLTAAIGPCLRAPAFEVGDDLIEEVVAIHPQAERFFEPKQNGKSIYDHVGFVRWRLNEAGLSADNIDDVGGCTLSAPDCWFSYRASRTKNEPDYGRNLSAIAAMPA